MTPHGLNALLQTRMSGRKPDEHIMLTFTGSDGYALYVTTWTHTEGVIRSRDNVDTLDLRPLVGLSVIVCCDAFGSRENRLLIRLQEYAADVTVLVQEWAMQSKTNFGLQWARGGEVLPFPGDA